MLSELHLEGFEAAFQQRSIHSIQANKIEQVDLILILASNSFVFLVVGAPSSVLAFPLLLVAPLLLPLYVVFPHLSGEGC